MIPRAPIPHKPTSLLQQCRNASTRKTKKAPAPKHTPPKSRPPTNNNTQLTMPVTNLANRAFVIETRVPFLQAKFRTPKSTPMIVCIVGLALSSLYFSSSAIPPPTPEETDTQNTPAAAADSPTLTDILTLPLRFLFRPILAAESAREAAKDNWKYWAGLGTGTGALALFVWAHCTAPRYVRYMAIGPPASSAAGGGGVAVGGVGGAAAAKTTSRGTGTATMQIYSAFRKHPITHPISGSTLVSPLLDPSRPSPSPSSPFPSSSKTTTPTPPTPPTRPSLRTLRILGPGATLPALGWGVCMFRHGAVVNGKLLTQHETVALMERIWLDNGGRIDVAKS